MQTHNFGATLQFGIVAAVDDRRHMLRVRLPALENMETDWLPMLTPAAGGDRFYSLPDEGEQVVCLLDARGEGGVVLGATYNDADAPPASSRDLHVFAYKNGTRIQHNRKTGDVLIKTPGTVTVDAPLSVFKQNVQIMGMLTYTGGLTASNGAGGAAAGVTGVMHVNGDILINGISMKGHIHTGDSGGDTSPPK